MSDEKLKDDLGGRMTQVHVAWSVNDDRGTRGTRLGVCTLRADAELLARGKGWHGGDGVVEAAWALVAADGAAYVLRWPEPVPLDLNLPREREALRRHALTKLSPAERVVLGLPVEAPPEDQVVAEARRILFQVLLRSLPHGTNVREEDGLVVASALTRPTVRTKVIREGEGVVRYLVGHRDEKQASWPRRTTDEVVSRTIELMGFATRSAPPTLRREER